MTVLIVGTTTAVLALAQSDLIVPAVPGGCDRAWEQLKGLPPMPKAKYEAWLANPRPRTLWWAAKELRIDEADMYYYMARVPFVIGAEQMPTIEQRDKWLTAASESGHKAAKAALMRLRYLGVIDMDWLDRGQGPKPLHDPRANRKEYLMAAREAAEAGDPEFASVMMDTARNINSFLHCQQADRKKADSNAACDPQEVTTPAETRRWAEVSGYGGNPNAMRLMCTMYRYGTYPQLGFEQDDNKAFRWCFAHETSVCRGDPLLLEEMFELGLGTAKDQGAAAELRKKHPEPRNAHKSISFPFTSQ